jgi:hypothetical protein
MYPMRCKYRSVLTGALVGMCCIAVGAVAQVTPSIIEVVPPASSGSGGSGTVTSVTLTTPNSTLSLGGSSCNSTTVFSCTADINLGNANLWAALQEYTKGDFGLLGSSTGYTLLESGLSGSSNNTLTLPTEASDTLVDLTGTQTLTNKTLTSPSLTSPTVTSSFTATGLVTNADLAHAATTVNGQTCTLGSTCTVTAAASSLTVGTTTISSGTNTDIEYNNGGTLGEYAVSGSGSVVMTTSPSISGLTVTSSLTATGLVTLGDLATQAANTILGNATSGSASPTALAIGSCSGATNALIWTTSSGFGCNTFSAVPSAANPTGTVGLSTVNGSAATFMRSDAAPPLSVSITPTWSGLHTFDAGLAFGAQTVAFGTTGAGVQGAWTHTDSTTAAGTVATNYEHLFGAVTETTPTNAITITNDYGAYFVKPVAGTHLTITNGYALGADNILSTSTSCSPMGIAVRASNYGMCSPASSELEFQAGSNILDYGVTNSSAWTTGVQFKAAYFTASTSTANGCSGTIYQIGTNTTGLTNVSGGTALELCSSGTDFLDYGVTTAGTLTLPKPVVLPTEALTVAETAAAWTTTGIGIVQSNTITDSSSSGTVATQYVNKLTPTVAATNASTIYTNSYTLDIEPPTAGTNVTQTNPFALLLDGGTTISGNITANSWTTNGIGLHSAGGVTYTDATGTGTVGTEAAFALPQATIAGSGAMTITHEGELYLPAPLAGTNVTATNLHSLVAAGSIYVETGATLFGGSVAVNTNSNFNTTINTGTSTGTITIGNSSNTGNTVLGGIATGTNADFLCLSAGGTVLLQGSSCTISSKRFKIDEGLITDGALVKIARLPVVKFRYKAANKDPNSKLDRAGLYAEDIAKIMPLCAVYENDLKTPKSYDDKCMIGYLVKGEQELLKRVAKLEAANDNLRKALAR